MTDPLDAQSDYKSKSIEEVIHDLTDKRFWQLANEVAKEGTRRDAANIIRKLCEEVTLARQAEQAARKKALEEAADACDRKLAAYPKDNLVARTMALVLRKSAKTSAP